jgi:hypothetical protein
MLTPDKSFSPAPVIPRSPELTTVELLGGLAQQPGKPLLFRYDGRDVLPGYHVTEVKSGAFEGLDCGANPEAWRETFIQLWDVPGESDRGWMPTSKFLAIMRKVTGELELGEKLTFEVSDGVSAMQLYRASGIEEQDGLVRVELTKRPSSCKPRDRWLTQ